MRRREFSERTDVGNVVVDVDAGQCLGEQKRQQKQYHPAAGRIVANLTVGFSPEQLREIARGPARCGEETREPRGLAAKKSPEEPEDHEREQRVTSGR